MAISTNQKPTIYRNLYENTAPDTQNIHDTTKENIRLQKHLTDAPGAK